MHDRHLPLPPVNHEVKRVHRSWAKPTHSIPNFGFELSHRNRWLRFTKPVASAAMSKNSLRSICQHPPSASQHVQPSALWKAGHLTAWSPLVLCADSCTACVGLPACMMKGRRQCTALRQQRQARQQQPHMLCFVLRAVP